MLGRALTAGLPEFGFSLVASLGHGECNIGDAHAVREVIGKHRPDAVFNAAAYTDVDGAESHADESYRANALGPENLARACEGQGAKLLHVSTDFVFDGEQARPYDEFDPPAPQSVYARSKVAGEGLARAACARTFVVRVGCLYGRSGRNFPSTILRRLRAGETIRADRERHGSPTWVTPVVRVLAALCRTNDFGVYHCTAHGETTWADYALFVATELGLPASRVEALPNAALSLKAARPRRAILDKRMLGMRGLDTLGTWQEQARAYIASET